MYLGDGVRSLSPAEQATARRAHAAAAAAGRVSKFTPASGAASRMFQSLLGARGAGLRTPHRPADQGRRRRQRRRRRADLRRQSAALRVRRRPGRGGGARRPADRRACSRRGDVGAVLDALLTPAGLDYAAAPKGLLLFHRYAEGARTAFEEHLVETAAVARAACGVARLHLTVSPEHAAGFTALLERVRGAYERRYDVALRGRVLDPAPLPPTRSRSTPTIGRSATAGRAAALPSRRPRGADRQPGGARRRPGVRQEHRQRRSPTTQRGPAFEWMQLLLGHAAALQAAIADHLRALRGGSPDAIAAARPTSRPTRSACRCRRRRRGGGAARRSIGRCASAAWCATPASRAAARSGCAARTAR